MEEERCTPPPPTTLPDDIPPLRSDTPPHAGVTVGSQDRAEAGSQGLTAGAHVPQAVAVGLLRGHLQAGWEQGTWAWQSWNTSSRSLLHSTSAMSL